MLKIGVVGIGGANTVGSKRGRSFIRVFNSMPQTEIAAVCDMLEQDLDAVVVASHVPAHAEHSIAALKSRKHVLSEGPACYDISECQGLVNAARESGKKYMLAENYCYFAYVETWKEMIKAGRIGRLIYAEGEYIHDCRSLMVNPDDRKTWRASLPPIHCITHSLGPIIQMMEARPVSAVGMHTGCNVASEIGAIDMEVALIRMSNGAVVKQLCGFSIAREPSHIFLSIYGTKGVLEGTRHDGGQVKGYFEDIPDFR